MIKNIFWNGIRAFVPIAVTFAVLFWIFQSLEAFFGFFVQKLIPPEYYFDGLGIIVGLASILALGIIVNAWIINKIYKLGIRMLQKIPVVKTVYNSLLDLINYFDKDKTTTQQQTVIINTPIGKALGFITRSSFDDISGFEGIKEPVAVYIPLSYQIGGITVIIPSKDVTVLDMPVEQAMRFVLSAGIMSKK